jgi:hypothetical protein
MLLDMQKMPILQKKSKNGESSIYIYIYKRILKGSDAVA